jgi:hypothetical protein
MASDGNRQPTTSPSDEASQIFCEGPAERNGKNQESMLSDMQDSHNIEEKYKILHREYSMNLERLDSLQWLLQTTLKEKSYVEKELASLKEACSEKEASFQETIRVYSLVMTTERTALQAEIDDSKQKAAYIQDKYQRQNDTFCGILSHILRSDKTPYLAFQQAYKQSGKPKEGRALLKRLQQLCHKMSIQQLATEQRSSGVLRKKTTSRSRSRGRKGKTSDR